MWIALYSSVKLPLQACTRDYVFIIYVYITNLLVFSFTGASCVLSNAFLQAVLWWSELATIQRPARDALVFFTGTAVQPMKKVRREAKMKLRERPMKDQRRCWRRSHTQLMTVASTVTMAMALWAARQLGKDSILERTERLRRENLNYLQNASQGAKGLGCSSFHGGIGCRGSGGGGSCTKWVSVASTERRSVGWIFRSSVVDKPRERRIASE